MPGLYPFRYLDETHLPMNYYLAVVVLDCLLAFVIFEKVLVCLDHKHLHRHHRHRDFQWSNFEHLDHVEMMFQRLDVVEMGHILY